jgi:hypothetical protein
MTKDTASIREVYTLVKESSDNSDKRFDELAAMFETFHKEEFQPLKEDIAKFKTYGVIAIALLSIIGSIVADWVKKHILHI